MVYYSDFFLILVFSVFYTQNNTIACFSNLNGAYNYTISFIINLSLL